MTNIRKNQFEEIIDKMMIEEVAGLDSEIRETLEGLDVSKKRMAILSILDKDRDMFMKIKRVVDETDVSKVEHIKNLSELMRAYVAVGEVEKKTLGEIMTPQSLVNDMMDTLPTEVWSNPDLKWLDPCSGVGIFSGVIAERLMDGLKNEITCEEDRYRHIMEKMIHVGELQPKNMFLFLAAFDPRDEYELNVYTGSFLDGDFDKHANDVWGIEKFDIVVGNPPYQMLKEGFKKSQPLWHLFVEKGLSITIEDGYMSMVHPSGWRNVSGVFKKTQKLLLKYHLLYLEVHNADDGIKTFGAGTRYDFYCLHKVKPITKTKIKTQNGIIEEIFINEMEYIPNGDFSVFINLTSTNDEKTVELTNSHSSYEHRRKWMSKEETGVFKYPCAQNINVKNEISCFWYSNTNNNGHFGVPKVMFSRKVCGVFIDEFGIYGCSEDVSFIIDDITLLKNIQIAMLSDKFIKIMKNCDFGGTRDKYNRKIIATFRKDFWKEFID